MVEDTAAEGMKMVGDTEMVEGMETVVDISMVGDTEMVEDMEMVMDTTMVGDMETLVVGMVADMEIMGTVEATGLATVAEAMDPDMVAGMVIQAMVVMAVAMVVMVAAAMVEGTVVVVDMVEVEDTVVVEGTVVDLVVLAILEVHMV